MAVRIDKVVTSGIFSLDGGDFEVDNNIWIVGDDEQVVVIDAAHDHEPIVAGVAGREVVAVVCTHGHNDHINVAAALADAVGAPIWVHPDDTMLWDVVNPDRPADAPLADGQRIEVGGTTLEVLHTPGHSPGGCCLYDAADGVLFSGDTLFNGGPGATGRSFSDESVILRSIADRLLVLPDETIVHTGHGDDTSVGAERAGVLAALDGSGPDDG
ncbi:MBL fold metallo-hydrolase [Aquihabitans sp. G128]|uniref:MBL fold metallo-hydrolase n=1 Tax=Aquihabitans sp. G128 TaxID=2849779 RepID=UPI001C227FF0|nr:MBL fold metallo-hydrolase [Aquihabitans sp. G128]QXC62578.1 MBL fold metallo-hydrolase [Aquihabitans sp. G128]